MAMSFGGSVLAGCRPALRKTEKTRDETKTARRKILFVTLIISPLADKISLVVLDQLQVFVDLRLQGFVLDFWQDLLQELAGLYGFPDVDVGDPQVNDHVDIVRRILEGGLEAGKRVGVPVHLVEDDALEVVISGRLAVLLDRLLDVFERRLKFILFIVKLGQAEGGCGV